MRRTDKYKEQVLEYIDKALIDTEMKQDRKNKLEKRKQCQNNKYKLEKSKQHLEDGLNNLHKFFKELTGLNHKKIKKDVEMIPTEKATLTALKLYEIAINMYGDSKQAKNQIADLDKARKEIEKIKNDMKELGTIDEQKEAVLKEQARGCFDRLIKNYDELIEESLKYVKTVEILSKPIKDGYQTEKEDLIKEINTIKSLYESENQQLKQEIAVISGNLRKISKEDAKLEQKGKDLHNEVEKYTKLQERLKNKIKDYTKIKNK